MQTKTIAVVLLAIAAVGIAIGTTTQSAHAQATHSTGMGSVCPPHQGPFCDKIVTSASGNVNAHILDRQNKIP